MTGFLLLAISLLVLLVFVRGRLFEPSRIMAGYWALILMACILVVPHTFVSFGPLLIPIACVTTFCIAAYLANPLHSPETGSAKLYPGRRNFPASYPRVLRYAMFAGIAAGTIAALVAAPEGAAVSGSGLADQVASISNQTARANYAGELQLGPLVSASLAVVYAICLVAPAGFLITRTRARLLYLLVPIASALPYAIITTQKAVFLYASACVLSSLVSTFVVVHGRAPALTPKRMGTAILAVASVVACFVALSVLRLGSFSGENVQIGTERVRSYLLFSLPAFASWEVSQAGVEATMNWGASSVAGLGALTGSDSAATKAYSDFVILPGESQATNVYTMFRNTQEDFGVVGQIVVFFGCGWIVGRCYRLAGAGSSKAGVVVSFAYALIFMSVAQVMTIFANVILSFIGAFTFVAIFARTQERDWGGDHLVTARPVILTHLSPTESDGPDQASEGADEPGRSRPPAHGRHTSNRE